ncbi:hypothetical protein [Brevibacterium album]|uniref:hypothetical protein n=1 Tax=Brevibacterium album TaxID=417948 RepID=UPI00041229D7|nr:hypothetical protein [Brevibacterium album]
MNPRDRLAYRCLLAAAVAAAALAVVLGAFGAWGGVAGCAGAWMIVMAALLHMQTRVINAGIRSVRDAAPARGSAAPHAAQTLARLDGISEDLAVVRARTEAEPAPDDVRTDLVQLAQSLRREVRLLQYSVSEAVSPAASSDADVRAGR